MRRPFSCSGRLPGLRYNIPMSRKAFLALTLLLFALGALIRLTDFTDLPLDFHPTRQLFSALKARGMCYAERTDVPAWQREQAVRQWQTQAAIEPTIVEHLAAWACRQTGVEVWLAGRALSLFFWLLGGAGVLLAARSWSSRVGALLALAVYLFLPYGVYASRSFQPDPLMVGLMALFWWALTRWEAQPTRRWTLAAGLLGGLAVLVKLTAVFMVGGAAAAVALGRYGLRGFWREKRVWQLAALMALPAAAYTLYGVFMAGYLGGQFGGRFFPAMLVSPFFYLRWGLKLTQVVGVLGLVSALLGLALTPRRGATLLAGVWGGYLLFGLVFNYHFSTHDYYHLPAIPALALSAAALGETAFQALERRWSRRSWAGAFFAALLLLGVLGTMWQERTQLRETDYRAEAETYAALGALLRGQGRVTALTPDYGYRLAYWGWLDAIYWPTVGDLGYSAKRGAEVDFSSLFAQKAGESDFFLVTDWEEWARQPALQALLADYPLWAQDETYWIYDLRQDE